MIYLDHNSTTFISLEVQSFMNELGKLPLNASSLHSYGRKARSIVENARLQLASFLVTSLNEYDIIFTASGTEANNLLIHNFQNADIFISAVEHASIYELINYSNNIKVISVNQDGIVDLNDLERQLAQSDNARKLVSIILANNETGIIQPITEIKEITKKYNAFLHSDIVQAIGKMLISIESLDIDFATVSAHKFGGPIGAAALIYKKSCPLIPMIIGGKQEKGLRSGTENVIAIAGMGLASEITAKEIGCRISKMLYLRDLLEDNLPSSWLILGKKQQRLPNTSLIIANNFRADSLLIALDLLGICVSSGAACSSGKAQKSVVLQTMGMNDEKIKSAIRVSLSYLNTQIEINKFNHAIDEIYYQQKVKAI